MRRVNWIKRTGAVVVVGVALMISACGGGGGGSSTVNQISGSGCSYKETVTNPTYPSLTSQATWSCTSSLRQLTANGIPDHVVGTFPNVNNPNTISSQTVNFAAPLSPATAAASSAGGEMSLGYALNGVKFDPQTAGSCSSEATSTAACSLIGNTGTWNIEALGQTLFNFGVDSSNAHVQPNGAYHYHGMPEATLTNNNVSSSHPAMLLVGYAPDGYPIYARWGYSSAMNANSALKVIKGSWQTKTTLDAIRPSTTTFPLGTFTQDYEYVANSGDLDECNGRTDVTPEFPAGIYHYYATDTYPYLPRCWKGRLQ